MEQQSTDPGGDAISRGGPESWPMQENKSKH
jgi:hypothetical protein